MLTKLRSAWRVGTAPHRAMGEFAAPVQAAVDAVAGRRVRVLAFGLWIGAASCLVVLGWRLSAGDLTCLDAWLLPAFAVITAGLGLAIRRHPNSERPLTVGLFFVTAAALLGKLFEILHVRLDRGTLALADLLLWFPLPLAMAFLGCRGRRPLVVMGVFLSLTAVVTLTALPGAPPGLQALLVRFLLAQASVFVVLVAAIELGESSSRATATVDALHGAAFVDGLTGVANRRCVEHQLAHLAVAPSGAAMGGVILDIDRFKGINDAHGHAAGDQVLRQVARTLQRQLRPSDLLGRWGGEEFVVLLPGANREGAAQVAERLRAAVEREVAIGGAPVTVSVGAAVREAPRTPESWIAAADAALYRAKAGGRNRVVLADRDIVNAVDGPIVETGT